MSSSATDQNGAVQKHRACDECRTRKLACTKEPDGCSRCKRENIACHYSAQKPMGRPRKRPREETDERPLAAAPPAKTAMSELPPDTQDPGMAFINLLLGDDFVWSQPPPEQQSVPEATEHAKPNGHAALNFVSNFGDVNFDPLPVESFTDTNIDPALFATPAPAADQLPALSPNSNNASSPESISTNTPPALSCTCSTKLFTALNSMQRLSTEVEPAIREARLAAKVAYECVICPLCSFNMELPTHDTQSTAAMVHHFQNMMLLATLIPSIVSAYSRILGVVDEEARRAVDERRQIVFKLPALGGVWGGLSGNGIDDVCGTVNHYAYREMEPVMWRLAVRALLKVDVYGISGSCTLPEKSPGLSVDPFHLGLKDIVLQMENNSKARHAMMDALINTGLWEPPGCGFLSANQPGQPPQCQRIIQIARSSVETLVIP
ncbi:hypothetical protein GGR57DRAFT_491931 [Xylariaceae sp. FL1272]|nr:hypothetical protein GGR57DRAFT_491931 [Xylariaceae sp. FL1272]